MKKLKSKQSRGRRNRSEWLKKSKWQRCLRISLGKKTKAKRKMKWLCFPSIQATFSGRKSVFTILRLINYLLDSSDGLNVVQYSKKQSNNTSEFIWEEFVVKGRNWMSKKKHSNVCVVELASICEEKCIQLARLFILKEKIRCWSLLPTIHYGVPSLNNPLFGMIVFDFGKRWTVNDNVCFENKLCLFQGLQWKFPLNTSLLKRLFQMIKR